MRLMKKTIFPALAIGLFIFLTANVSQAITFTYATDIRWDNGGGAAPNTTIDRYNQSSALGAPDNLFLSLGLGGSAVFDFGTEFNAAAIVFETTNGSRANYPEAANVYVADSLYNFTGLNATNGAASISPSDFTFVQSLNNLSASVQIDLSALSGGPFRYVLIQDATIGGPSTEGFDVNAVGVAPVPEPSTLLLLGAGLAGLGIFRRFKKSA